MVLYPYAKEILHNMCQWPVSRKELNKCIAKAEINAPNIIFNTTLMDDFEHPNCWYVEVMSNNKLKE